MVFVWEKCNNAPPPPFFSFSFFLQREKSKMVLRNWVQHHPGFVAGALFGGACAGVMLYHRKAIGKAALSWRMLRSVLVSKRRVFVVSSEEAWSKVEPLLLRYCLHNVCHDFVCCYKNTTSQLSNSFLWWNHRSVVDELSDKGQLGNQWAVGWASVSGYTIKALSCTSTCLNPRISQFLHPTNSSNLMLEDSNLLALFADKHVERKSIR